MKRILLGLMILATALNLLGGVCQTRHPDPAAWKSRMQRALSKPVGTAQMVRRAAVAAGETQLDVVDVLMAFDSSARTWLKRKGRGLPQTFAQQQVIQMNKCLEGSRLLDYFRFRLAGVVELNVDLSGRDLGDVLDGIVDGYGKVIATGELRKVPEARESVGADVVSILVANGEEGTIGIGYSLEDSEGSPFSSMPDLIPEFGDWAYNACSIETCDTDHTMLHEIGHHMGAGHPDRGCADPYEFTGYMWTGNRWELVLGAELGPQLYPYSAGYYLWVNGRGYYTVMSYNFGGRGPQGETGLGYFFDPLPYFSSPNLSWNGVRLGTKNNDNRQTLIDTYRGVAQYRVSKQAAAITNEVISINGVTGAFHPQKALNGVAPYVGAVRDASGNIQGMVQLRIGKENLRRGTARVSGQVTTLDGQKCSIRGVNFPVGDEPQVMSGLAVTKLGTLELTLGSSGFYGRLSTTEGEWSLAPAVIGGGLSQSPAHFSIEDFTAPELAGYVCLERLLPNGQSVDVSGTRWSAGAASLIKYRRVAGTSPAVYELVGTADAAKPNVSALKLSYAARTGTFKGSFRMYYSNEGTVAAGRSPRLKKISLSVAGVVVDHVGMGKATCRRPSGQWAISLQ